MKQFFKSMLSEPGSENISLARCVSALFAVVSAVIVPLVFWHMIHTSGTDLTTWIGALGGLAAFFSALVGVPYGLNKIPTSLTDSLGKLLRKD